MTNTVQVDAAVAAAATEGVAVAAAALGLVVRAVAELAAAALSWAWVLLAHDKGLHLLVYHLEQLQALVLLTKTHSPNLILQVDES